MSMLRSIAILLSILCTISCESQKKESLPAEKVLIVEENQISKSVKNDSISLDFLTGKFDPSKHPDFVKINPEHTDKSNIYLQREVYDQFLKMRSAAAKEGIRLIIRSATRNFDAQKKIWERKWDALVAEGKTNETEMALEILQYSSMPGTSRHHWGTDMDLNSLDNLWFGSPEGQKLYNWLVNNASKFGFCQPYTAKGPERLTGYEEEKWHWSYLPLSKKYLSVAGLNLKDEMISGFKGSESASEIEVVKNYVLGIHPSCK